jgi:catechol 2,3-dioxygenase-like lactoylglutathione lyase family enzyme
MGTLFRVEDIDHLVLRCRDQVRMLDFYVRVLGLVEERRLDALGLIQLRAGRSLLDLVPRAPEEADAPGNLDHFCLAIGAADLPAVAASLAAAGVELIGEPYPRYGARGTGPSLYIRDPDGNVVELKADPPSGS